MCIRDSVCSVGQYFVDCGGDFLWFDVRPDPVLIDAVLQQQLPRDCRELCKPRDGPSRRHRRIYRRLSGFRQYGAGRCRCILYCVVDRSRSTAMGNDYGGYLRRGCNRYLYLCFSRAKLVAMNFMTVVLTSYARCDPRIVARTP